MAETPELLSIVEAATLAGVSERTMRRWSASGQVRTVGLNHVRRVPVSEIAANDIQPGRPATDTRTSAAGMWQTRAEGLGMQLDQARSELRAL